MHKKEQDLKSLFDHLKKFTYSKNISFEGEKVDDIGWGCTLRSGQMLLINFILL